MKYTKRASRYHFYMVPVDPKYRGTINIKDIVYSTKKKARRLELGCQKRLKQGTSHAS